MDVVKAQRMGGRLKVQHGDCRCDCSRWSVLLVDGKVDGKEFGNAERDRGEAESDSHRSGHTRALVLLRVSGDNL